MKTLMRKTIGLFATAIIVIFMAVIIIKNIDDKMIQAFLIICAAVLLISACIWGLSAFVKRDEETEESFSHNQGSSGLKQNHDTGKMR